MELLYDSILAEQCTGAQASQLWNEWLWGCDCNEQPSEQCCDMNRMHGLGILCCVREMVVPVPAYSRSVAECIPELPAIHLHGDKPICQFSLRELTDQLECMQLNWGQIVSIAKDSSLLRAIMARVGFIASNAFETGKPEDGYEDSVLDDPQHTTALPQGQVSIVSRKSLRQTVCVLLGLARVQDIVERSVAVPEQSAEAQQQYVVSALKQHHIEASMDFFNGLQQMMHLAPGMRLVYRTNFSGMYNDVSQVIYFHFPKFSRQPQVGLRDVNKHAMNLLPLIREMMPDIAVAYDDDSQIQGLTNAAAGCSWLISCGTVFLVENGTIFRANTLLELVCFWLQKTGRKLIVEDEEDEGGCVKRKKRAAEASFTEHGHVQVMARLA